MSNILSDRFTHSFSRVEPLHNWETGGVGKFRSPFTSYLLPLTSYLLPPIPYPLSPKL